MNCKITQFCNALDRLDPEKPDGVIADLNDLVHLLERHYPNYVPKLINSIEQKATYNSIIILHRIMNSELSKEGQSQYLALLKAVVDSNTADKMTKEKAQKFNDLHSKNI